jgi:hypothetical protein
MKFALRRIAFGTGLGGLVVLLAGALAADLALGRDVLMIAPHEQSVVELNRMLYVEGEPVPQLYGNPLSGETRVILPSKERLLQPEEDPALLLLQVDKLSGENPLQTKTIWFLTKFAAAGFALLALLGFALPRKQPVRRGDR